MTPTQLHNKQQRLFPGLDLPSICLAVRMACNNGEWTEGHMRVVRTFLLAKGLCWVKPDMGRSTMSKQSFSMDTSVRQMVMAACKMLDATLEEMP